VILDLAVERCWQLVAAPPEKLSSRRQPTPRPARTTCRRALVGRPVSWAARRRRTCARGRYAARVCDDGYFDALVAARYDDASSDAFDPSVVDPAVDVLAELADGGRALEFAVGTGRIALPLARRGLEVCGIELSAAMVARLRAKPDGDALPVTVGDMATTVVDGSFALVYLVFNTIMNLTTQAAQVACFRNAARHLQPGGCFVVEVMVPDLQRLPPGETIRPFHVSASRWSFDEYDVAAQGLVSHHLQVADGQVRRQTIPFRYVWPAELDLMAQLAGMTLAQRWSGWDRAPFTSDSRQHVSVWRVPTA
jgi:SAM-dependent methyltransferase